MTDSYDKLNRRVRYGLSRVLHTIMHSFSGVEVVYLKTCASHVLVQGTFGATVTNATSAAT